MTYNEKLYNKSIYVYRYIQTNSVLSLFYIIRTPVITVDGVLTAVLLSTVKLIALTWPPRCKSLHD